MGLWALDCLLDWAGMSMEDDMVTGRYRRWRRGVGACRGQRCGGGGGGGAGIVCPGSVGSPNNRLPG